MELACCVPAWRMNMSGTRRAPRARYQLLAQLASSTRTNLRTPRARAAGSKAGGERLRFLSPPVAPRCHCTRSGSAASSSPRFRRGSTESGEAAGRRMAEPGKETAPPPPPPQAAEAVGDRAAASGPDPRTSASEPTSQAPPAAMVELGGETAASPLMPQATEAIGDRKAATDPAPRPAASPEPARLEAAGETRPVTKAERVATPPPPTEAPPPPPPPPLPKATDAGKQLPAPPPQQQKREDSSVHEAGKDTAPAQEGKEKSARGLWARARAAVLLAFPRPKTKSAPQPEDKGGETKPPAPAGKQPSLGKGDKKPASAKKPNPKDSSGGVPAAKEEDEGDGGKSLSRRDEEQVEAEKLPTESQAGVVAGGAAAGETSAGKKRLQKMGRLVQWLMSWYKRHRSSSLGDGKGGDTKAPASGEKEPASGQEEEKATEKKKKHPKWREEEERLEAILEGAFTKLLVTEYSQLSCTKQKCLLTFSVFHLAADVKKQSMVYWWVSEFNLLHWRSDLPEPGSNSSAPGSPAGTVRTRCRPKWRRRRKATAAPPAEGSDSPARQGKAADDDKTDTAAESIFSELSRLGFLEPTEQNRCKGAIHGCKVNPLVHWMVKHQARDDRFADLDRRGNPADRQPESAILCLTAGNRAWLQEIAMEDEPQAGDKQQMAGKGTSEQRSTKQDGEPTKGPQHMPRIPNNEQKENLALKRKEVIININAHVYRLSEPLLSQLPENLAVLQLGQWWSLDDSTYMEVEGLDSLCAISNLKNLRYLSLRGLSRLTNLPDKMQWAKNLTILDLHGCQNLERVVSKTISPLKKLTHLDLSDCYMLEYIDKGVTSLSELQVFKGFVFGVGIKGTNSCSLQDLKKLKKLQKLTISVTIDATIKKNQMEELKHLSSLRSLTVTWGELPSILTNESKKKEREEFLKTWTSLELPPELLKLDIRCYPDVVLVLKEHKKLKKLYIRGGEMKELKVQGQIHIKILRLRYLKNFSMEWKILLATLKDIEYVEIMVKDNKLISRMVKNEKDGKNREEKEKALMEAMKKEHQKLMDRMKIPDFTLDENGVWVRDKKEEENQNLATRIVDQPTLTSNGGAKKEVENKGTVGDAKKEVEGQGTARDTKKEVEDRSTIEQRKDVSKDLDNTRENDDDDGAAISQLESKEEVMHSSRRPEIAHNGPHFHSKSNEIVNDTDDLDDKDTK